MNVPKASEEPEVLIQPEFGVVQNLFQTNPVIALDTEFVEDKLAYIQIGFLHSNKVCVFTHNAEFRGFSETFLSWLKGNVAIIGFFMSVDLLALWRHFGIIKAPSSEILMYKVLDLYLFLKFIHNGFKNANSLADWSKRLVNVELDKKHQKTNWFTTPLDKNITEYLKNDVWVLHKLLNYVREIQHLHYYNTWTGQKHFYFETSYQLDQVLIPLFLDISLQGVSVSMENLEVEQTKIQNEREILLLKSGLTLDIYRSSKKFTEFIRYTMHPISSLANIWPTTKTGSFNKSQKTLSAWVTQHTANPLFQNAEIVEWFTNFFTLAQNESFSRFFDALQTHINNNTIYPLWDLMGADTGRITTSHPALHSTPRDSTARSIVVPSKPGYVFVIADYKTIELVIQAILANETTMLHVFQNGLDLHTFLASKIFNQPYEELMELKKSNPKEFKRIRNSMKPVNFGKTYGMGAQTLWQRFLSLGQNRTFEEVEALHRGWDATFPQIHLYQKRCKNLYDQSIAPLPQLGGTNYITSLSGRIRRPEMALKDGNNYLNFTQIINFPIQATCTDFLKTALRNLYFLIKAGTLPAIVVLSAHDEIMFECRQSDAAMVEQLVTKVMISAAQEVLTPIMPNAPIEVDSGIGQSWADKP